MTKLTRLLGYVWLAFLGLALFVSAADAFVYTMEVEEYAKCCDSFGYLRMAQEVRLAASQGRYPDYSLETPHTRSLIDFLKSQNVPLGAWDEMVAPHAHHYFPRADRVGVQYPPGTGMLLALFPQRKAVHGLNQAVIGILLAVGLAVLVVAGRIRAWAAAGGAIFALQIGLDILGGMYDSSFSINAMLAPLLLAFGSFFLALFLRSAAGKPRASWVVAFLGGACFGMAILARTPVLLLLPGTVILVFGAFWRSCTNGVAIAFAVGLGLCGILPLLVHQQHVAGAWYLSTYAGKDNASANLEVLETNLDYYFGSGAGNQFNRALVKALVGLTGLAIWMGPIKHSPLGWRRLILSAFVLWAIPTGYFLTHKVTVPYYPFPATFAALVVLALGGLTAACCARWWANGDEAGKRRRWRMLALPVAMWPGFVALEQTWPFRIPAFPAEVVGHQTHIPAELTEERAWVFADFLTGTLWYEAKQPAHKIWFTDKSTRFLVYRFVFDRGEPMYVIRDCESMYSVLYEIEQMRGKPERRGDVDGSPYFLIHWPDSGPVSDHLGNAR